MSETKFLISMPFTKVDKEKRTVTGLATTEAIDKQNEQVSYDASKEAFGAWSGNIREMHSPNAVGKAVSWTPDDEKRGIKVEAYISKGAEDTWQKILDGTLKAFSIGGQTVSKVQQIIKDEASGGQRHVTKITKYKLTELSLVDNPANPEASFELVKMENGIPTQTQLVEDIKKVLVNESKDILEDEVNEHRSKADHLVKKVLSSDDLSKLDSENWGVIRKYEKEGSQYIERMLPMPDKVHAVRALEVIDKYNLNEEEQDRVHELAKSILGSDYEVYVSATNRGGELKQMNKDILNALKDLSKKVSEIETKVFGKVVTSTSDLKTQEEVAAPAKESKESSGEFAGKVPAEGEKQNLPDVSAKDGSETPVKTQEEGNVAPKKTDDKDAKGEIEGKVPAEGEKQSIDEASSATPSLKTQEEGNVAPVKKDGVPEAKKVKPTLKTQEEGNVAPVKKDVEPVAKPIEDSDVEEAEESEEEKAKELEEANVNKQILKELQSLRKRLDAIETQPMPRKYNTVQKRFIGNQEEDSTSGLEVDIQKATQLRKDQREHGRKLTPEEESFCQNTISKSLDLKFGATIKKIS